MIIESSNALSEISSIAHGFFTRAGGVSTDVYASLNCSTKVNDDHEKVSINRARALSSIGLPDHALVIPNLVHSNNSLIVDESLAFVDEEADGVITTSPKIALAVTYSDCLPILISSTDGEVIAAIHAGWRGVRNGVIEKTFHKLKTFEKKFIAAVGPAISPQGFSVTDDVRDFFVAWWPNFTADNELCTVDLTGIACAQLRACGVLSVEKVGGYTDLDADRYFSHRRDRGATGRHIAIIGRVKTH